MKTNSTKTTTRLACIAGFALTASMANAATIIYNFEQSGLTGYTLGSTTLSAAAASNDFGAGVTASLHQFSMSNTTRHIGYVGGQARATLITNVDNPHTFTVTIDDTVTVDLTGLSFKSGAVFADHSWTLSISQGSADKLSGSYTGNGSGTANNFTTVTDTLTLSGLTGLTDTSVTFTLIDTTDSNNNTTNFFSYFDDITITGTASPIPEPSAALLGGLGLLALLRRRRS